MKSFPLSHDTLSSEHHPITNFNNPVWTPPAKHNGQIGTEKIFEIFELSVSMGKMNPNLVSASQNKCKKRKKDFEIGEI